MSFPEVECLLIHLVNGRIRARKRLFRWWLENLRVSLLLEVKNIQLIWSSERDRRGREREVACGNDKIDEHESERDSRTSAEIRRSKSLLPLQGSTDK